MAKNDQDSANKSDEQRKTENEAALDPKQETPGVQLNHGEPSDRLKADQERAREALKDPFGNTPAQQRDSHDEAVDPQKNDAIVYPGQQNAGAPIPDGLNPGSSNESREDGTEVQGTLPPV